MNAQEIIAALADVRLSDIAEGAHYCMLDNWPWR